LPPTQTELVAELAARWARGDRTAIEELVHPEVEIDMTVRVMNPEVYRGYEGLWRYEADITELWEYGETEVQRRMERGDEVLEVQTTPMRARASGVEFSRPIAQRYRFEDGRVIRLTMLLDVERAVADFEAGRPPHPPDE
jgi:ketosteroid isomerase-like protein